MLSRVVDMHHVNITLTHKLALPAQLRNSCWRSLLEKKRSSTRLWEVIPSEVGGILLALTVGSRRIHFHGVSHLSRKESGHCLCLSRGFVEGYTSEKGFNKYSLYPVRWLDMKHQN